MFHLTHRLQFSYVGMVTQIIPVNGRNQIDVVMASDTELLDEVVDWLWNNAEKTGYKFYYLISASDLPKGVGGSSIANALRER